MHLADAGRLRASEVALIELDAQLSLDLGKLFR